MQITMNGNKLRNIFISELIHKREEAKSTYPIYNELKYCKYCYEPLKYGTVEFSKGYHLDTCFK